MKVKKRRLPVSMIKGYKRVGRWVFRGPRGLRADWPAFHKYKLRAWAIKRSIVKGSDRGWYRKVVAYLKDHPANSIGRHHLWGIKYNFGNNFGSKR